MLNPFRTIPEEVNKEEFYQLLMETNEKLDRIIDILERQGSISPG
jgi:hypothetical protein